MNKTEEGTRPRILIVEDSATQAQRLRYILERNGYEVALAINGRLALSEAAAFGPSLVISDVVMPEMNGYELSSRIKADPLLRHIPVILVTTMSDPHDVIRGLECGADNFVLKPYEERYLLARIRYVLVNREVRRQADVSIGVEIVFNDQRHFITADRLQILNLLLSTYDAAIQRNRELTNNKEELELVNTRLATANRELDSFSASVSHDLRAPLRHIDGYVAMLIDDAESQLSSTALRYLQVIVDSSRRMGDLIDNLLEFSRMNRTELNETEVDVEALVREVIGQLEPPASSRQIEWKVGAIPAVAADPAMLRQVFVNLLSNAVKYSRPRERAIIEIGTSTQEGSLVEVFVRDNGVGFDMRYADKLFGVFQRLHTAAEFEGTGIGLANVRRIVTRLGGKVRAESAVGEGATFFVTLRRPSVHRELT